MPLRDGPAVDLSGGGPDLTISEVRLLVPAGAGNLAQKRCETGHSACAKVRAIVPVTMGHGDLPIEAREAVQEIQAYLSDEKAPLLVVDSLGILFGYPPSLGAEAVRLWVAAQTRGVGAEASLSDYLYHAVTKLRMLGRLGLVSPELLQPYLEGLIELLVEQVPLGDREALREQLLRGSIAEANMARTDQVLHRPGSAGPTTAPADGIASASALTADMAASLRQLTLLLARQREAKVDGVAESSENQELMSQLIISAIESANSREELEQHLARARSAGIEAPVSLSGVLAALSRGLPNWWLESASGGAAFLGAPVQAMRRVVDLTADRTTAAEQFRELLQNAAEQFNEGALPRALQVLEVARHQLSAGKVDRETADLILRKAHEDLDPAQLMTQTQNAAALPQLRTLLATYPALTPGGLLETLDDEPDRSRRRLWIALLEAHGEPARRAALARLEQSFEDSGVTTHAAWLRRNFVYLLHRIRPQDEESPEHRSDLELEVALTVRCSELGNIAPLVREALTNLGLRRHPESEATLRKRLAALERHLEQPEGAPYEAPELMRMLKLVVNGLVRQGTPSARRAAVEHGLRQKPHLGDTVEHLAELGSCDLSDDPKLVDRLLEALRARLPVKLLGFSLRRHEEPLHLIRALQGTRSGTVKRELAELAKRFPSEPFGEAAASVLAAWEGGTEAPLAPVASAAASPGDPEPEERSAMEASPTPAAMTPASFSLAGDLAAFGLPDVMQTISQAQMSGRLVLRAATGSRFGEVLFREGSLRDAKVGELPMPDAVLQLLEVPEGGTFELTRTPAEEIPAGPVHDVMGLIMEGMRRYDELQRAKALVPDHAHLRPTGQKPSPPPNEQDGAFVRELWTAVRGGASALQCADTVLADAYRIRSALAHWLTEGVLEIAAPTPDVPR